MTEQLCSRKRRELRQNIVAFDHAENFHHAPMLYYIKILIVRKIRIMWVRLQRHDHDTRNILPSQVKLYESMKFHPISITDQGQGQGQSNSGTPSGKNVSHKDFDQGRVHPLTKDVNLCGHHESRVQIEETIDDGSELQATMKEHEGSERNTVQRAEAIEVVMVQKFSGDFNENSDDSYRRSPSLTEPTTISTDRAKTDQGDRQAKSSARRFSFKRFIASRLRWAVKRRRSDSWFIQKPEYQCHNAKHVMEMVFYDVQ